MPTARPEYVHKTPHDNTSTSVYGHSCNTSTSVCGPCTGYRWHALDHSTHSIELMGMHSTAHSRLGERGSVSVEVAGICGYSTAGGIRLGYHSALAIAQRILRTHMRTQRASRPLESDGWIGISLQHTYPTSEIPAQQVSGGFNRRQISSQSTTKRSITTPFGRLVASICIHQHLHPASASALTSRTCKRRRRHCPRQ